MTATPVATLPLATGLQLMMATVLDLLVDNLATTLGGPVGRTVLAPGSAVPADSCCPVDDGDLGGQAHVRLSRAYPTRNFPAQDMAYSRIPAMMAVEFEIGVFRCVAGMDGNGNPPPAEHVTAGAIVGLDDMAALQNTAATVFGGNTPRVVGAITTLGPAGYCVGIQLTFVTQINPACPPA